MPKRKTADLVVVATGTNEEPAQILRYFPTWTTAQVYITNRIDDLEKHSIKLIDRDGNLVHFDNGILMQYWDSSYNYSKELWNDLFLIAWLNNHQDELKAKHRPTVPHSGIF